MGDELLTRAVALLDPVRVALSQIEALVSREKTFDPRTADRVFHIGLPDSVEVLLGPIVKDSNGAKLADGDSVTLIKDLKVKGTSETLKRGTLVKNIRLTGKPDEIECSAKQVKGLVLKTEFLKKA